mmetsp:Transcript_30684/g.65195  ORF Transcript_30684/g.65195 Transcript_30684/m.65195 type:complete len:366 (-) Transcript_30684:899-1996(-)
MYPYPLASLTHPLESMLTTCTLSPYFSLINGLSNSSTITPSLFFGFLFFFCARLGYDPCEKCLTNFFATGPTPAPPPDADTVAHESSLWGEEMRGTNPAMDWLRRAGRVRVLASTSHRPPSPPSSSDSSSSLMVRLTLRPWRTSSRSSFSSEAAAAMAAMSSKAESSTPASPLSPPEEPPSALSIASSIMGMSAPAGECRGETKSSPPRRRPLPLSPSPRSRPPSSSPPPLPISTVAHLASTFSSSSWHSTQVWETPISVSTGLGGNAPPPRVLFSVVMGDPLASNLFLSSSLTFSFFSESFVALELTGLPGNVLVPALALCFLTNSSTSLFTTSSSCLRPLSALGRVCSNRVGYTSRPPFTATA